MFSKFALVATLALAIPANAQFFTIVYPTQDVVPPTNVQWTAAFSANVPNLPQSGPNGLSNPNLGLGKMNCLGSKRFAMTFDDGPSTPTPGLLDALKARNVKVTFFIVGSRVVDYSDTLLRAYNEGHQIALHTWSHPHLTSLTNDQIIAEITYGASIVRDIIGVTPAYFRPPYGDIDGRVAAILKNMGLTPITWAVDSGDSAGGTDAAGVYANYTRLNPNQSPIGLEHDLFPQEADQGPVAVDAVLAANYTVVRLDECLNGSPAAYSEVMWQKIGNTTVPPATTTAAPSKTTGGSSFNSQIATSTNPSVTQTVKANAANGVNGLPSTLAALAAVAAAVFTF